MTRRGGPRTKLRVVLLALVLVLVHCMVGPAAPVQAAEPIPYEGPEWMAKLAWIGDSITYIDTNAYKDAARSAWWRPAMTSFPALPVDIARDQIRPMAADRPDAFIVELGAGSILQIGKGERTPSQVAADVRGAITDIHSAGVPCLVWVEPNAGLPGVPDINGLTTFLNDTVRAELVAQGAGISLDWTSRVSGHPEYLLPDLAHLTPAGVQAYSAMILDGLRNCTSNPIGSLDSVVPGLGTIGVQGWAADVETASPVGVRVDLDGTPSTTLYADRSRPDVAAVFPLAGGHRGFAGSVPASSGPHRVCVTALNQGPHGFHDTSLGCRNVTVSGSPVGSVDSVVAKGPGVHVMGWTLDPDTTASIGVHVYVDGIGRSVSVATGARPDVDAAYGRGPAHGFDVTVDGIDRGDHQVCVYGINATGTPGGNALVACRAVFVSEGPAPLGSLDGARVVGPGSVQVTGWALDPDTTASIGVHVYVDGIGRSATVATGARPDVDAAYGRGPAHGFDATIDGLGAGSHQVCVYGINAAGTPGGNALIDCWTIVVPTGPSDAATSAPQRATGDEPATSWERPDPQLAPGSSDQSRAVVEEPATLPDSTTTVVPRSSWGSAAPDTTTIPRHR